MEVPSGQQPSREQHLVLNVDNIKNMSSGTLEVDWTYTNEDGTTGTNVVSTSVNFTEK